MRDCAAKLLSLFIFLPMLLPGTVLAHSHAAPGEHVKEFQQHLGDYEENVREMVSVLGDIVADYQRGRDMSGRMDGFVDLWEEVKYHEAVETVTTFLYAPIWQGIGGLRSALEEGAPVEEVRRWQQRLEGALWQGIGALKLAAQRNDGQAGSAGMQAPADGPATVKQIISNLDSAVADYADGHTGAAKQLIHDTYMQLFEGLEGELIERDPQLVVDLEEEFNATLPLLMDKGVPVAKARAVVDRMKTALKEAARLLEAAESEQGKVF